MLQFIGDQQNKYNRDFNSKNRIEILTLSSKDNTYRH